MLPLDIHYLGTFRCAQSDSMPEVHARQTVHLSYAETNTVSKRTKTSFHLTYITLVLSGVPKAIAMPEVHSAQTGHLSYAETNTISKRTKTGSHSTHIT